MDSLSAHLEIEADRACMPSDRLEARVRQRSQRLRFVEAAPDVPALRVRVDRQAGQALAIELQVTRPGGRRSVRRLRARSCDDALEATALVIAITLDESASIDDMPSQDAAAIDAESDAAVHDRARSESAADEAKSKAPAGGMTNSASKAANGDARASDVYEFDASAFGGGKREARRFHFGVGVAGQAVGGAAPMVLPGVGVFAVLGWGHTGFSPALRASLVEFFRASQEEAAGTASFGARGLILDLCPLGLRTGPLTLRACAEASALAVSAEGADTFSPRSRTRPHVALGGSLATSVDLGARVGLVGSAGVGKNLIRDRFIFSPSVFYHVPSASWEAAAGIELRFP